MKERGVGMDQHIPVLNSMLLARGLHMARVNPTEELLLPPADTAEHRTAYRSILEHYAARLLLKEVINTEDPEKWRKARANVEKFCDAGAVDDFLSRFVEIGVLSISDNGVPSPVKKVSSFGPTYEWYTADVLSSNFNCPSVWGVTFENFGTGGDHDVLSSLSGNFLYLEVKTSPPGRIEPPEIASFVDRLVHIAPDIAVFHNDTHLRMKDKIVPMMEAALEKAFGERGERVHFKYVAREIFHFRSAVYLINSKPDLRRNLDVVFRHYFRSKSLVLHSIP